MASEYAVLPVYSQQLREFDPSFEEDFSFEGYEDVLVRKEDGEIKEILFVDGIEPEDALLRRDLSWILPALHDAYRRGAQEGSSSE